MGWRDGERERERVMGGQTERTKALERLRIVIQGEAMGGREGGEEERMKTECVGWQMAKDFRDLSRPWIRFRSSWGKCVAKQVRTGCVCVCVDAECVCEGMAEGKDC